MVEQTTVNDESNEEETQVEDTKTEPVHTLEILKIINDCQQQHGLRHSDYQRYRGYCTRRIQRLRQTLHFPQSDKRHFKKRDVTVNHLKDERFLYIPLMLAERTWGYAMQLRQEANTEPRKRFHLASKIRKAVVYAEQLEALCQSDVCDARSKLEAQAYLSWMKGSLYFELHLWKEALDHYQQAQVVYEKLCGVVKEVDVPIYKHKVEELIPSLRYCAYSIGDNSAITDLKGLREVAQGDVLDNLDRLMAEARAKEGSSMAEVEWRGHKLQVRPPSVGAFLIAEGDLTSVELGQSGVDTLERHLIHCKDAIAALKDLMATEQTTKMKTETGVPPLQLLLSYLTYIRLTRSNQRTLLMISMAKADSSDKQSQASAEVRKGKPQDLIRLYELVIQNLNEMQQLAGLERDDDFQADIEASLTAYKAFRCYYIGEVLMSTKKLREAHALYSKADSYLSMLDGDSRIKNSSDVSLRTELASLGEKVKVSRCVCVAQAVLQQQEGETTIPQPATTATLAKVPLIDRLDTYYEDPNLMNKKANLVKIPPELDMIMCKPLYFDISMNYLKFPQLEEKEKKVAEGGPQQGISSFVKGLWGWGGKK